MNYADIKTVDVANGPGIRVSLFVSGCSHHCKNCFNREAWDFHYGKVFTEDTLEKLLEYLKPDYIKGLSLLGGEPLEPENQQGVLLVVKRVKECYPQKTIWCYTGFTFEEDILGTMWDTNPITRELFSYLDVLVDGKYVEELHDLNLNFRGSSNQRIIKVPESLKEGKVVLHELNNETARGIGEESANTGRI